MADPVDIGPFQNIVEVSWPGMKGNALLLYGSATFALDATPPSINFSNLPPGVTEVPEFLSAPGESGQSRAGALVFDIQYIKKQIPKEFTFTVTLPHVGGSHTIEQTFYWLWSSAFVSSFEENLANPILVGDPQNPPFGTMTLPRAFSTAGQRAGYSASETWHYAETTESQVIDDSANASFGITTYKNRKTFPLDGENEPTFDDDPEDVLSTGGGGIEGTMASPQGPKSFSVKVKYSKGLVTVTEVT